MSQVTFVAEAHNSSLVGTTMVINKPTGTVDGDLMIAHFAAGGVNGNTMTTLAGWTAIYQNNTSDQSHFFSKIASSEGSSYTWTHWNANNNSICGTISTFRSSHQTVPVAEYTEVYDSGNNTTNTGTAITPTTSPTALLCMFNAAYVVSSISGYAVANNNPTWTETYDFSSDSVGADCTVSMAYASYDFITTTGTPTATIANAATGHVTMISIRPTGQAISAAVLTETIANPATTGAGIGIAAPVLSVADSFKTPIETTANLKFANTSKNSSTFTNQSKS